MPKVKEKTTKTPKVNKATYIDWVEPYPPAQVETDDYQQAKHGGNPKQKVMKDNTQLVRVLVTQDLKLGPNRNHPIGVHFITAAEAHAHSGAIASPPVQSEE